MEGNEIQDRILWRLPGLKHSLYPGVEEAFMIQKENTVTHEKDDQYFITNCSPENWSDSEILDRILLHWETETGVFGIKDRVFLEDKVRYFSLPGTAAHVALLNTAWNCLFAPALNHYWSESSINCRMRFLMDHPEFNPFSLY